MKYVNKKAYAIVELVRSVQLTEDFGTQKTFTRVIIEEVFINNTWYNLNKGNILLDL